MSLIGALYADIKAHKRFRIRYLKSLVNLLDHSLQFREITVPIERDFAQFVVENLLCLEYGNIEEVYTVINTIESIISTTGISLLQTIKRAESQDLIGINAQHSVVLSLLVGLKLQLKVIYNLTEAKHRAFDPKTGTVKEKKPPVRARPLVAIEWPNIPYLYKPFETISQMQDQLYAVPFFVRCTDDSLKK